MTADQLHALINQARSALVKLEPPIDGEFVLLNRDGYKITITGYRIEGTWLVFDATIINDNTHSIRYSTGDAYLNGWSVFGNYCQDLAPGKKARTQFTFSEIDKADVQRLEDLSELEFTLSIEDLDTLTYWKGIDRVYWNFPIA